MILRLSMLLCSLAACARAPQSEEPPIAPSRPRIVTLSQTMALSGVVYRVVMVDTAGPVSGSLTVLSGAANRVHLEARFGCRMRRSGSDRGWQCTVPFGRRVPDWGALLGQLDRAGLNAPPSNGLQLAPILICNDGTPWELTMRSPAERVLVRDAQVCGPISPPREAYEQQIESVVASVVALADSA